MKKTIFFRIFSGYLLITLTMSTLILIFSFKTIRNHYIDTLTSDLKNLAISFQLKTIPFLREGNFGELDSLIKDLGKNIHTRITIINPEGIVLADSEKDPLLMENHLTRPEVMQASYGKVGTSLRYSTTLKEELLYVAIPVRENGEMLAVLRVSLFLSQINVLLTDIKVKILQVMAIVVAISLLVAFIFSRKFSKPIKELVLASRRVANGDFSVKVFPESKGELQELSGSFNYMISRIKELVTEISQQKGALNSIIESIQEGLLVLDKKGRIIISNDSLERILDNTSISGRFYWEVIRKPKLAELIKRIKEGKTGGPEEIEINDRNFICSASFLKSSEETVFTFHDITEMKRLEEMKKDFVVNISHELRTPLTAIKGFLETLEESIDEKNRQYVDILSRHTERLTNIVKDLLLLSSLEERRLGLEPEKVNLEELLNNILSIYKHAIKEKNLRLIIDVEKDIPDIKADPFKLEQMFINLIENAIKYTEEGEIKISLKREGKKIRIDIKDTGIGISQKHLPRIFERFYTVDKSRSRKLGGTGLGLSIVKHIVLLHNGTIDVKSTPGKGTIFSITLPNVYK